MCLRSYVGNAFWKLEKCTCRHFFEWSIGLNCYAVPGSSVDFIVTRPFLSKFNEQINKETVR